MSRHPSWWMEMEWKTWRNQVGLHHQCHQTLVALIDTASVAMMSLMQHRGRLYATQFASRSVTGCRCRSGFLHTRESCNVNITRSVLSPAQSHSVAIVVISLLHWAVNTFIQESSIFYFVTYVIVESCDNCFYLCDAIQVQYMSWPGVCQKLEFDRNGWAIWAGFWHRCYHCHFVVQCVTHSMSPLFSCCSWELFNTGGHCYIFIVNEIQKKTFWMFLLCIFQEVGWEESLRNDVFLCRMGCKT